VRLVPKLLVRYPGKHLAGGGAFFRELLLEKLDKCHNGFF
jgi:hypothetical protein